MNTNFKVIFLKIENILILLCGMPVNTPLARPETLPKQCKTNKKRHEFPSKENSCLI